MRSLSSRSPSGYSLPFNELALNCHVHETTLLTSPSDPYTELSSGRPLNHISSSSEYTLPYMPSSLLSRYSTPP